MGFQFKIKGYSLLEIVFALAISASMMILIMANYSGVFMRQAWLQQSSLQHMQLNSANEAISMLIRQAGNLGCSALFLGETVSGGPLGGKGMREWQEHNGLVISRYNNGSWQPEIPESISRVALRDSPVVGILYRSPQAITPAGALESGGWYIDINNAFLSFSKDERWLLSDCQKSEWVQLNRVIKTNNSYRLELKSPLQNDYSIGVELGLINAHMLYMVKSSFDSPYYNNSDSLYIANISQQNSNDWYGQAWFEPIDAYDVVYENDVHKLTISGAGLDDTKITRERVIAK